MIPLPHTFVREKDEVRLGCSSCSWLVPLCLLFFGPSDPPALRGKEGAAELFLIIFLILL